jgi:hypothetical protein
MGAVNPPGVNKKAAFATAQKVFGALRGPQKAGGPAQPSDIPTTGYSAPANPSVSGGDGKPMGQVIADPASAFGYGAGPSAPMVPGPSGDLHTTPLRPAPALPAAGPGNAMGTGARRPADVADTYAGEGTKFTQPSKRGGLR